MISKFELQQNAVLSSNEKRLWGQIKLFIPNNIKNIPPIHLMQAKPTASLQYSSPGSSQLNLSKQPQSRKLPVPTRSNPLWKIDAPNKITSKLMQGQETMIRMKISSPNPDPYIRTARSGDITLKLSKQNNKLKNNVQQLHSIFKKGQSPTARLTKVSSLYQNKAQKYREKVQQNQQILAHVSEQVGEFRQWWTQKFNDSTTKAGLSRRLQSAEKIDWLVEQKLRDSLSRVKLKIDELQIIYRHAMNDWQSEKQTLQKEVRTLFYKFNEDDEPKIDLQNYKFLIELSGLQKNNAQSVIVDIFSMGRENKYLRENILKLKGQNEALSSKFKENVIQVEDCESEVADQVKIIQNEKDSLLQTLKDLKKEKELESQFLKEQLNEYKEKLNSYKNQEKYTSILCSQRSQAKIQKLEKQLIFLRQEDFCKGAEVKNCMNLINDCEQLIMDREKNIQSLKKEMETFKIQRNKLQENLEGEVNFWKKKCEETLDKESIDIIKEKQEGKSLLSISPSKSEGRRAIFTIFEESESEITNPSLLLNGLEQKINELQSQLQIESSRGTERDYPEVKDRQISKLKEIYQIAHRSIQSYQAVISDSQQLKHDFQQLLQQKQQKSIEIKEAQELIGEDTTSIANGFQSYLSKQVERREQILNLKFNGILESILLVATGNSIKNSEKTVYQLIITQIRESHKKLESYEKSLANFQKCLLNFLSKIDGISKQVSQIQDQLNENNKILISAMKQPSSILGNLEKLLSENDSLMNEQIEKQKNTINFSLIRKYLGILQLNIRKMQKNRGDNMILEDSFHKKDIQIILMQEIKQLKQQNQNLLFNLKESLTKIEGKENFVSEISQLYGFSIDPKGHIGKFTHNEAQISILTFEAITEHLVSEQISECQLNSLRQLLLALKSKEQKQRETYLETKDCFLHLYLDESVDDIEHIKFLLAQKLTLPELEELFNEDETHENIINQLRENIKQLEENSSLLTNRTTRSIEWIEKARKKYFPVSSELSEVLQQHLIRLCKAESDEVYLAEIESVFEHLQHHEQKFNQKLRKKDEVFKSRVGKITKIYQREQIKQEQQIRKSMIISHDFYSEPSRGLLYIKEKNNKIQQNSI